MSLTHGLYLSYKHKAKFIMNQTYVHQEEYEWEGYYVYSWMAGGFLHE
jgi:hypothetical protein